MKRFSTQQPEQNSPVNPAEADKFGQELDRMSSSMKVNDPKEILK